MRKLLAGASALILMLSRSAPTFAGNALQVGGVGLSGTDCTQGLVNTGNNQPLSLDSQGKLCVNAVISSTGGTTSVVGSGPVTNGTAQSGSLLTGGVNNTTLPTLTNGQQAATQLDTDGIEYTRVFFKGQGAWAATGTNADGLGVNASANVAQVNAEGRKFNGTNWDRDFTCTLTASVNVTAGNTTQIVALSGSTVIRVCSVSLGIATTGTVNVLTGTGTNCGTPTTISTAINLSAGNMWQQSAPAGGSLFRSTAGGEICIAAVTGNVTGFITYAQY